MKTFIFTAMLSAFPALLYARWGQGYGCAYGPGGYFGFGGGTVLWIITLAVAAFLVVYGIRSFRNRPGTSASGESAADILKARYARGEITREQYNEMKNDL